MERIILHKALSYYFGTDAFSIMPKDNDFIIEKENIRHLLSEIDITEQYQQAEYEYQKIKNKERIEEIKAELDRLDLKKIRFLLEKEKGDLSGEEDFQKREKETVKLRKEFREINNE